MTISINNITAVKYMFFAGIGGWNNLFLLPRGNQSFRNVATDHARRECVFWQPRPHRAHAAEGQRPFLFLARRTQNGNCPFVKRTQKFYCNRSFTFNCIFSNFQDILHRHHLTLAEANPEKHPGFV